jgi:ADP-ribose pyrophosphatase YjhB (NUDIX family)
MIFTIKQPVSPDGGWKTDLPEPTPFTVVSGFALNANGQFLILHRSDAVRSAKNCWALPSGLHVRGLSKEAQFCNELKEEFDLNPVIESCLDVGSYENIALTDRFHWFIHVMAVYVHNLEDFVNREPDKHDQAKLMTLEDLEYVGNWAPMLGEFITANLPKFRGIFTAVTSGIIGKR